MIVTETPAAGRPRRRRLAIRFAAFIRWLHIYVSMFGLIAVLFFSVTGVTLNHPDWFLGEMESRSDVEGRIDPKLLIPASPSGEVAKLEVVEHLRKAHDVRGALVEFKVDDAECLVAFKGPGYAADAFINRDDGKYTLSQTAHGLVGVINDLHKGRDSGPVWSLVVDVSALLLVVISLSGLILIFYLKLRRVPGVVVAIAGGFVVGLLYWFGVP
ncbi:PepSY-associated TM helix domain-containing protein [Paludisphaera borealis]|uniref:Peptidase n=1 Tax=Paludisphaera borealis TaxID=1387353 RepID=A0A1U7CUF2_9BACT|nr:PepSY-associated TM helix domain-containing protein [Paludisphaera borealis]APW62503.1 hypothetical protein BSF38_04049 [Paludisphaera borealis]